MSIRCTFGATVLAASLLCVGGAVADDVEPPQGYIGFDHVFRGPVPKHPQPGFYNFDYDFMLGSTGAKLAGTFWAFNFSFQNSTGQLPDNHVNKDPPVDQGGYVGVQVISPTESIAIFSIWWTLDATAGEGAHCLFGDETWEVEPGKIAGGPFYSCRLPIALQKGVKYRLRLSEISDASKPDKPEWWGTWLINLDTGAENFIGQIKTRGKWGWLNRDTGGFIEHFAAMPAGCDSIPASRSTFFPATANYSTYKSRLNARVYGTCAESISARTTIACKPNTRCKIDVGSP